MYPSSFTRRWRALAWLLGPVVIAGTLTAHAQAPSWQTAVIVANRSNTSYLQVRDMVTDAGGSLYLAGSFRGTIRLGSTTLTSAPGPGGDAYVEDAFVAKWTPTGGYQWAVRAGGPGYDYADALALRGASLYVVGSFRGSTAFGSTTLAAGGISDAFVAKLTDAGTSASFAWAQQIGGAGIEEANAVAASGTGVYVAGNFSGSAASFGSAALASAGGKDLFATKLIDAGPTGSFEWAQRAGGPADDWASGVAVSGANVYVVGYFRNTAAFGSTTLTDAGFGDMYVAKLTDAGATGSFTWAQRAGGTLSDGANAVVASGANVYVAGYYVGGAVSFGGIVAAGSNGGDEAFVAKLADAGPSASFVWVQRAGGASDDAASHLSVNGANLYVAGSFESSAASFGSTSLTSAGNDDVFLAKLTDAGASSSFAWARRAGSTRADYPSGVATQGATVYVTGTSLGDALDFGSIALTTPGPTGAPVSFVASLTDASPMNSLTPALLAGVQVYPNPARHATTVHLPASLGKGPATLTLYDAQGRTVHVRALPIPASGTVANLPLADLAAGLYRVRVQVGDQQISRSLVVE